jgi:hypothetical protein
MKAVQKMKAGEVASGNKWSRLQRTLKSEA